MKKKTNKPDHARSKDKSAGGAPTPVAQKDARRKPTARYGKKLILTQRVIPGVKYIKVRLNPRTIVMLKSMRNFAFWKERYPAAEVME